MSAGSRTSEVGRCVRLAATSSQRCLLPIPIVGRIASVAILQRFNIIAHGYFNVLICPTAMATSICLATLASSQRCLLPIPIVGRIASAAILSMAILVISYCLLSS